MKNHLTPDYVLSALGDNVAQGLGRAVSLAREDLTTYREQHPDWVVRHSSRGLANWIQDHLWFHVMAELDEDEAVDIQERGATREIIVASTFRFRLKRHDLNGLVASYPTQTAIEFMEQPKGQLPGLELVHLIAGYEWDKEERKILRAVLSLRDGAEILWVVQLPEDAQGSAQVITIPPATSPTPASIQVLTDRRADDEVQAGE